MSHFHQACHHSDVLDNHGWIGGGVPNGFQKRKCPGNMFSTKMSFVLVNIFISFVHFQMFT